jgi:hypothetical protein
MRMCKEMNTKLILDGHDGASNEQEQQQPTRRSKRPNRGQLMLLPGTNIEARALRWSYTSRPCGHAALQLHRPVHQSCMHATSAITSTAGCTSGHLEARWPCNSPRCALFACM